MSSIPAGGIGAIHAAQTEKSQQALKDVFRKLASNLNVNQASDNAANLAIAERFNSELKGVNQATLNANDGVSVVQIADAGLQQIQDGQQRLRELATQSANGSLSDSDRQAIQAEAAQIQEQIDSVIANTRYDDIDLLASGDTISLQTGPDVGDQSSIKLTDLASSLTTVDLSTQTGAQSALVTLMADQSTVSAARSEMGAAESGLTSSISRLCGLSEALAASGSSIRDADIAQQSTQLIAASIRANAGLAIQTQANNLATERVQQLVQ